MSKKYHVGKDGQVRECTAKKQCPYGGPEAHFDTFEGAQRYADEINKKTIEESNQEDNETNENQVEKPLNRTGTMYDNPGKKEHYELSVEKQINNILKKVNNARKNIEKKEKIFKRPEYRGKTREEIIREELSKSGYSHDIHRLNYQENGLKNLKMHRTQVEHFSQNVKVEEVSYSRKSSSTYVAIKKANYKKAVEYFKSHGYNFQTNPEIDKLKPNEKVEIRFSNHKPSKYYADKDKDESNLWQYTKSDVLVDYQDKQMKVKGSSNILATNKNINTYRGEVVGRHNVSDFTKKILRSKPNVSNRTEIEEDIKTLKYSLGFPHSMEEKTDIRTAIEKRQSILKEIKKNTPSKTKKKKQQRHYKGR